MELGVIIKNSIIIAAILGVAFLSQSDYFKSLSKNYLYSQGFKKDNKYINKTNDWLKSNIFSKISGVGGEVAKDNGPVQSIEQSVQESLQGEIEKQKNNISQNTLGKIKNYLAEKVLQTLGVKPEDLQTSQQAKCQN